MSIIKEYLENRKLKKQVKRKMELVEEANSTYQITEYHKEIWITFNGVRCIPASYLSDEPLKVIEGLRKLYIENHG